MKYCEKKVKKLGLWDIKLIKIAVFFFAFFVASFISPKIMQDYRWLWFVIFVFAAIKPFIKVFKK